MSCQAAAHAAKMDWRGPECLHSEELLEELIIGRGPIIDVLCVDQATNMVCLPSHRLPVKQTQQLLNSSSPVVRLLGHLIESSSGKLASGAPGKVIGDYVTFLFRVKFRTATGASCSHLASGK